MPRHTQHLDADYVKSMMRRLAAIPDDVQSPCTKGELIAHWVWFLRHAMGKSTQVPFYGGFWSRRVVRSLVMAGLLPPPRCVRLPARRAAQGIQTREPGDLETLHALLEDYLNLVQADALAPAWHPWLGDIGVDGWDRVLLADFERHLQTFCV